MNKLTIRILMVLVIVLSLTVVTTVLAQDYDDGITDDQVNEIAGKLYCPVCENITLDACQTKACEDWRYEIRLQLENYKTEGEIIDDFVARFGDRVVGVPQDPVLRALSLVAPWVIIGTLLIGGFIIYLRWQQGQKAVVNQAPPPQSPSGEHIEDDYMSQLERDLSEK